MSGDVPIEVTGGQEYTVTASFTNPLVKPMTNVVFYIEGARVVKAQKIEGKYVTLDTVCPQCGVTNAAAGIFSFRHSYTQVGVTSQGLATQSKCLPPSSGGY